MVREELLHSLTEIEDGDEPELDEAVKTMKDPKERSIALIELFEDILKTQNKRIINLVGRQVQLFKRFKEPDGFMDTVGLSCSYVCFKIWLHKFLSKYPLLKFLSTRPSNCFRANLRLVKKVCTDNSGLFAKKHKWFYLTIVFLDFSPVASCDDFALFG